MQAGSFEHLMQQKQDDEDRGYKIHDIAEELGDEIYDGIIDLIEEAAKGDDRLRDLIWDHVRVRVRE